MTGFPAISRKLIDRVRPPRHQGRSAALTLRDINDHPDGATALSELGTTYVISEAAAGLLLTQRDADLRLFLYDLDSVLGAARRNAARREQEASARRSAKRYGPEDFVPALDDLAAARQVIARLEQRVAELQSIRKEIIDQREHWRRRAMRAEQKHHVPSPAIADGGDKRYATLRRFLARRFHPDHAPGSGIEKIIRNEIFKEVWTEIGRIDSADR